MEEINIDYDHTQKKMMEACRIDEEAFKLRMEFIKDEISREPSKRPSEVVELQENTFSKRELAYLVVAFQMS